MKLLTTILLSLTITAGYAQDNKKKEKKIGISGYVIDTFTKASVPNDSLKVLILGTDSAVVDTASVYSYNQYYGGFKNVGYDANVPARPGKYIIKATHPDYETTYMNYEIKRIGRNRYFELPTLKMRRIQRGYDKDGGDLKEVVVKATKVKMVYKGDTIVYNADAFNIPDGSMLDGLIKQLPGVELKDNGEIFVNGKKVDNLTLNGADFFKGKNKMMLENLPYYAVKNVQVYDKQTPKSKFLGRDVEQKEFTMDVVLKREYNVGGTVFVEGGYGTDKRYRAKGFGLRYSDHSRAVLFGGANNLNEYMDVDQNGEENTRTDASGDRDIRQVGGLWTLGTSENKLTNTVEYNLKWEDNHTESRSQTENYLAGASTFGLNQNTSNNRPFSLSARNVLHIEKPFYLYSWVDFNYNHTNFNAEGYSLTARDVLFGDSVNLTRSRSINKSDQMTLNFNNSVDIKLPWGDLLELQLSGGGNRIWNSNHFSQNSYKFFDTGTIDQRNQYNSQPSHSIDISGSAGYRINLSDNFSLTPMVGLGYNDKTNDRNLYRLDWLGSDWAVDGRHPIGQLPESDAIMKSALDMPNSSTEAFRQNMQSAYLEASYNRSNEKGYFYLMGQISQQFRQNHMTYDCDQLHAVMNKDYSFTHLYVNLYYAFDKYRKQISFYAQNQYQLPTIGQMVDITSTANPLSINKGNPDLKPMSYWYFNGSFRSRKDSIDQHFNISISGQIRRNAFVGAYTYNPANGVYTYWTENVNGNWNMSSNIDFARALGKKKFWNIATTLYGTIYQSTDMSSISGQTEAQRNRVTTTHLGLTPSLRYQKDKLTFTLKANGSWQHIRRSIEVNQMPTDVYDFGYGFNANYKLPWNFTIDTDIQMHSRRGYAEAEMNDNRLYWDATLTKSWRSGRWVIKLKGYDLLGQVSHWQYYVNSQGRYETWTNNMRRYALLSLAYRFSLKPKGK